MILRNIILSVLVIGMAFLGAKLIIMKKPKASMKAKSALGTLVEAKQFGRTDQEAVIVGQGIVTPAEQVNLIAQVSGVVSRVHPQLSVGGRVTKGAKLIQIDPTDYSLAVTEARARVKIAEQEVSLEAGRRLAAETEWEMMQRRGGGGSVSEASKSRALRKPQEAIAQSNLKIARNALRRAQVSYGRTTLKAPFNGVILNESVDPGQLVGPGAPVATLAGTDVFWVTASIPTSELGWIQLPSKDKRRKRRGKSRKAKRDASSLGSRAIIRYDVGAEIVEREGRVIRQLTQVETTGRMARVIVEVKDPLGLKEEVTPLLLGAQVEVRIIGKPLVDVIEVPRSALHEGRVWVFSPQRSKARSEGLLKSADSEAPLSNRDQLTGSLELRSVKILRRRERSIVLREGLTEDDFVITSRLSTPVPGMRLRLAP